MKIALPDANGHLKDYDLTGTPLTPTPLSAQPSRIVFAAAHVVADPFADDDPTVDWGKTMEFRRYLADLGIGIAEAMDTAQRGMGLDWPGALELITRTKAEVPDAMVFNGCGTDQLLAEDAQSLDSVVAAYIEQVEAIQNVRGRIVLMASRALAKVATSPDDYVRVYGQVLAACDAPVILHWLGEMFDPELSGYWGYSNVPAAMETALTVIAANTSKIDGIKISLLEKTAEIEMRRRLPDGVKMYTGDDFSYPELIAGDAQGFSHALLGIFDPLAAAVGPAMQRLDTGDIDGFREVLDPTVPLARLIFRAPTQHYKSGVVFLAWLNGFQDHFIMLSGAQSMRTLPYYIDCFKLAEQNGLLRDPDLAVNRMSSLLKLYGL